MEETGPQFVLNPGTMLAVGAIMGVLTGAIGKLFQTLMEAKDQQIKHMEGEIDEALKDRDFWRNQANSLTGPTERALDIADDAMRRSRQRR